MINLKHEHYERNIILVSQHNDEFEEEKDATSWNIEISSQTTSLMEVVRRKGLKEWR